MVKLKQSIELKMSKHKIWAEGNNKVELKQSFFGEEMGGKLFLRPEEAFYLTNIRRANLVEDGKKIELEEILKRFYFRDFFVKYNVLRDWRDRGLFIKFKIKKGDYGKSPAKKYPESKVMLPRFDFKLYFLPEEMVSLVFDKKSRILFEKYWIGQWGVYKAIGRGKILQIDPIETLYLSKIGYEVINVVGKGKLKFEDILNRVREKISQIEALLSVYEDWRNRGYILKTGFKFGAHFRIYFPGASPVKKEWIHSKHVIHVFPKDVKMVMSEWARAVRVAHSVRKTFIMAIPGMKAEDYLKEKTPIDFAAYHRSKGKVERPDKDVPSFLIIALGEDEELSGKMLASALDIADEMGLRLLIAITDRETSVTYYLANKIELPNSENKYYEVEWFTP